MAFNVNNTYEYLTAVAQLTPPVTFLRDRYFPTSASDIFSSDKVLVEFKDGNKKIAPVVAPRVGGVTMLREGSTLHEFEPPTIAPKRNTSIDDIRKRGFGEAILPTLTPEERESQLALKDALELDEFISRREEQIAAELLQNNGYILQQVADDVTNPEPFEIFFYDKLQVSGNPASYTVSAPWNSADADILGDLSVMIKLLTSKGLPAQELLVSGDVVDAILNDPVLYKKLLVPDGKFNAGRIDPKLLPNGATYIATLNVKGRNIDILSYDEGYEDDNGDNIPFLAPGTAILTAPAIGRTLYGAVTQIDQEDLEWHTYGARRVPKTVIDPVSNVKDVILTSKPLLIPVNKNPFVTAKNILANA
jgi:hypothetical protein